MPNLLLSSEEAHHYVKLPETNDPHPGSDRDLSTALKKKDTLLSKDCVDILRRWDASKQSRVKALSDLAAAYRGGPASLCCLARWITQLTPPSSDKTHHRTTEEIVSKVISSDIERFYSTEVIDNPLRRAVRNQMEAAVAATAPKAWSRCPPHWIEGLMKRSVDDRSLWYPLILSLLHKHQETKNAAENVRNRKQNKRKRSDLEGKSPEDSDIMSSDNKRTRVADSCHTIDLMFRRASTSSKVCARSVEDVLAAVKLPSVQNCFEPSAAFLEELLVKMPNASSTLLNNILSAIQSVTSNGLHSLLLFDRLIKVLNAKLVEEKTSTENGIDKNESEMAALKYRRVAQEMHRRVSERWGEEANPFAFRRSLISIGNSDDVGNEKGDSELNVASVMEALMELRGNLKAAGLDVYDGSHRIDRIQSNGERRVQLSKLMLSTLVKVRNALRKLRTVRCRENLQPPMPHSLMTQLRLLLKPIIKVLHDPYHELATISDGSALRDELAWVAAEAASKNGADDGNLVSMLQISSGICNVESHLSYSGMFRYQTENSAARQTSNSELDQLESSTGKKISGFTSSGSIALDLKGLISHPAVSVGVLHWIEIAWLSPRSSSNSTIHLSNLLPIFLGLLREISNRHVLQRGLVFDILCAAFLLPLKELDAVKVLKSKQKILTQLVLFMEHPGFGLSVLRFISERAADTDHALLRYFLKNLMDLAAPPYGKEFSKAVLRLLKCKWMRQAMMTSQSKLYQNFVALFENNLKEAAVKAIKS
eukprot:g3644.t1